MHVMTKLTLGLGTVLFVISVIAFVIGGAELDSALEDFTPNSVGYEYWTGDTSTEFNGELKWSSVYFVFVEEGYEVDVEVSGSGHFNPVKNMVIVMILTYFPDMITLAI